MVSRAHHERNAEWVWRGTKEDVVSDRGAGSSLLWTLALVESGMHVACRAGMGYHQTEP